MILEGNSYFCNIQKDKKVFPLNPIKEMLQTAQQKTQQKNSDTPAQKKDFDYASMLKGHASVVDLNRGSANSQPVQKMVAEEEESNALQKKDEEEEVQAKVVQKQEKEEEDVQAKIVQKQKEEEEIQTKSNGKKGTDNSNSTTSVGQKNSLPDDVQAKMESSFGTSFSNVNIHTNDNSASEMGALAYTQGNNVHFAPRQYNPGTSAGQELIGHELAHVVQQRAGRVKATNQGKGLSVNNDQSLENEADVMGKRAADGQTNNIAQTSGVIQNKPDNPIQGYFDFKVGFGRSLSMSIPDGSYVLDKANIPVSTGQRLKSGDKVFATAGQYSPRNLNGLDAAPHNITSKSGYNIVPGSSQEDKKGQGSTKVQVYQDNLLRDSLELEGYLRFDTEPLIKNIGATSFVTGYAYDLDPSKHEYFEVVDGSSVQQTISYSKTISNGYAVTNSQTITNTIGSSISSEIGADVKVLSAKIGSEINASMSVANSISESISGTLTNSTSVSLSSTFNKPGKYAIVPNAKVWCTPLTVNMYDSTGKIVGTTIKYVYTIIYNTAPVTCKVGSDGKSLYDSAGTKIN